MVFGIRIHKPVGVNSNGQERDKAILESVHPMVSMWHSHLGDLGSDWYQNDNVSDYSNWFINLNILSYGIRAKVKVVVYLLGKAF